MEITLLDSVVHLCLEVSTVWKIHILWLRDIQVEFLLMDNILQWQSDVDDDFGLSSEQGCTVQSVQLEDDLSSILVNNYGKNSVTWRQWGFESWMDCNACAWSVYANLLTCNADVCLSDPGLQQCLPMVLNRYKHNNWFRFQWQHTQMQAPSVPSVFNCYTLTRE